MYIIKNIVAKTGYLRSGMAKYCYRFPNTVIDIILPSRKRRVINLKTIHRGKK
jgi:hypothetical protein